MLLDLELEVLLDPIRKIEASEGLRGLDAGFPCPFDSEE